jgi:hypothetical protein
VTVQRDGKRPLTIVVLTAEQSQQLSVVQLAGQRRLLLSADQAYVDGNALQMRSVGDSKFRFAIYPALTTAPKATTTAAAWSTASRTSASAPCQRWRQRGGDASASRPRSRQRWHLPGLRSIASCQRKSQHHANARSTGSRTYRHRRHRESGDPAAAGKLQAAGAWQINVPREQLKASTTPCCKSTSSATSAACIPAPACWTTGTTAATNGRSACASKPPCWTSH